MNTFSIYLPHFSNNLSEQFVVCVSKQLLKKMDFKVGEWEINGISEQDALSKLYACLSS